MLSSKHAVWVNSRVRSRSSVVLSLAQARTKESGPSTPSKLTGVDKWQLIWKNLNNETREEEVI